MNGGGKEPGPPSAIGKQSPPLDSYDKGEIGMALSCPQRMEFSRLAGLSTDELEKSLMDEASFGALLTKVMADEVVRGSSAACSVEAMRRGNVALAQANLAKESELVEVRRQIAIVKSTEYEPALETFNEYRKRQEAARGNLAPEILIDRLREAVEQAEDMALELERKFFAGEISVVPFVKDYSAARARYHRLHLKLEAAIQNIPMDRRK